MTRDGISSLADIEAIERTPLAERQLPASPFDAIAEAADRWPRRPALRFVLDARSYGKTHDISFRDLAARLHQTANALHRLGVGPDDVVSMVLPNVPQAMYTIYGGMAAGIVNPINPLLDADAIADIMNAAGTKVLVTLGPTPGSDLWPKVARILPRVHSIEAVLLVDLTVLVPGLKGFVARVLSLVQSGPRVTVPIQDFDRSLAVERGDRLDSGRRIQPDDVACLFHTGGTTGTPKLARHRHGAQVVDSWSAGRWLRLPEGAIYLCGLPLFHVNGVFVTGLIPWLDGCTVLMTTPQGYRGPGVLENFWRIVEHHRVAVFSCVPTVYSSLLDVPLDGADVSSLVYGICGSAPMPVELFRRFEERTGIHILEGYGLTEATCVSAVNPSTGERRVGSVGVRLAYQPLGVARIDDDGHFERWCDVDEVGEVLLTGPTIFLGYLDPAHDAQAWIEVATGSGGEPADAPHPDGRWLRTGDLGRLDADGYLWLTGRVKELIIRGGHNIDPKSIEEPLHRHPDVALAAAVGRPDPRLGEVPVAYVQLAEGAEATEEVLLAWAADHVGERAAIPKAIHVVDEMPLTAIGKIFKPALVRRQIGEVLGRALRDLEIVERATVDARADATHGTVAEVTIEATEGASGDGALDAAREVLDRFTVRYELSLADD